MKSFPPKQNAALSWMRLQSIMAVASQFRDSIPTSAKVSTLIYVYLSYSPYAYTISVNLFVIAFSILLYTVSIKFFLNLNDNLRAEFSALADDDEEEEGKEKSWIC